MAAAQILQRIGLRDYADIVFQGKDFANAHTVNGLGIRKNNANGAGLDRLIEVLALGVFVQNFHSWLRQANRALTAPQIGIRRLWPQQGALCGLMSSVPHVPCSGPEHRGGYPGPRAASAWKIGCPCPLVTPYPAQTEPRWRRCSGSEQRCLRFQSTAPPAGRVGTGRRNALLCRPVALTRSARRKRHIWFKRTHKLRP